MRNRSASADSKEGLSPEVDARIEALWSAAEDRRRVRDALRSYGIETYEQEALRVRLAILKLSEGDVAKALSAVSAAKGDYRDVLKWAEYPEESAFWGRQTQLTEAEKAHLEEIRRRDRKQYEEWLEQSQQ